MKKIYVVAGFCLSGLFSTAQFLEDFESFNLSPESYDNGSGGTGDFYFSDLILNNFYDTAWGGYWVGFSISNITDNTTAGIGNQYSSFTGSGANGSAVYGVAYDNPTITGSGGIIIDSFRIANNTYAALSMRDGDFFGKQFGSIYNANGVIDGTNGEDYFKVWAIAHSNITSDKDSVEFYLADYRFADSALDYIYDGWTTIDVSGFGFLTGSVTFRFESSDMSAGYINTPLYFVLDDIYYWPLEGLDELAELKIEAYPNPVLNQLIVSGEEGELLIFDMQGALVYSTAHQGASHIDVSTWPQGSYLLEVRSDKGVARRKLIK